MFLACVITAQSRARVSSEPRGSDDDGELHNKPAYADDDELIKPRLRAGS